MFCFRQTITIYIIGELIETHGLDGTWNWGIHDFITVCPLIAQTNVGVEIKFIRFHPICWR